MLLNLGIESLNEMQEVAQDAILNDSNVLLLSPTGSGKTLAFLPILEMLNRNFICSMFNSSSFSQWDYKSNKCGKMGTDYEVNVCYGGHL
jgi:superfamily II DNA/RNA helicase